MTVYHQLLNKEAYRTNTVPSPGSLYEESQALMFAGSDTTGHALMVGTFHLINKQSTVRTTLREELLNAWPDLEVEPSLRSLEKLPYLNAVIKEALRMDSGVVSGLARIVPEGGASIDGTNVPGGVRFTACELHVVTDVNRPLFHAEVPSSIGMRLSSPNHSNSALSVGLKTQVLTTGWCLSPKDHGHAWV